MSHRIARGQVDRKRSTGAARTLWRAKDKGLPVSVRQFRWIGV